MESVITYPHSVPGLHPISAFSKSKLGRLSFSLKEIADGPFLFTHQSSIQLPISNIRADGNRRARPAQSSESGRSINGDDNKTPRSSEGKTYNKDEILALFRRIQSSISSGDSTTSKGRTNNPSAESVLEVLRQSRKQVKGKTSHREGSTVLGERKKEQKKGERIDFTSTEAKISRPPSSFVKRSPIPSAHVERVQDEVKSATDGEEELETMKLAALKELARSRGIKGYSKLKKGELVELLKTL